MVSALWKACSEGDLENVLELLKSASAVDIEIKDHTGSTPLIEAIKIGHVEIVKVLLERGMCSMTDATPIGNEFSFPGADPSNASSQGLPEQFTSDPAILDLIKSAQSKVNQSALSQPDMSYIQDPNSDASKHYYPPPPGYYYHPGMPAPHLPEGSIPYYPPPPPQSAPGEHSPGGGPGNLPPPDVARLIPCRYFPACRYGSSCIFAHPQAPYFQGPLPPPAQYPIHYDPNAPSPYSHNYYAVVPPSFVPPPNGVAHMSPTSPQAGPQSAPTHPQMGHGRSGSEVIAPHPGHFTPVNPPPPGPYGAVSPVSPAYPHPASMPVPVTIPSLPPLHHPVPSHPGPQSPQTMYPNAASNGPVSPFHVRHDSVGQYPPQNLPAHGPADPSLGPKSPPLHPQADGYMPGPPHHHHHRDASHHRRGSLRKPSFGGSRKPPCLFFPSGRCRNGDECRFPHVMPDGPLPQQPPYFPGGRGGHHHRPRGPPHVNGVAAIEEKMADMTVRDVSTSYSSISWLKQDIGDHSSRSQSTEPGGRSRSSQHSKGSQTNGIRYDKKATLRQRVPSLDEFPALSGTATPPKQSPGLTGPNGFVGPTAAQILQGPTRLRKAGSKETISARSSENGQPTPPVKDPKPVVEVNGSTHMPMPEPPYHKLPISFAAVTAAPESSKEVSVSA
ncbi:hypothetical protein JAAARDRAFT_121021 [Jaapia argillacea MUCL 33604]|uniref:C3H1-type domain-containing protein n=1 Tax=Jaapia argillacea MUCL 33604 TaxID=933084 RepID=A0A067Q8M5_9AGAM|nr:hypothetical protein JAAARDRAFT_121021 [Jaapia argillacea MUCL 33604]